MDTYSKKFAPVICPPWYPTREAFERYMAREVELARHNLLIAGRHGQTLHSDRVRMLARAPVPVIANISVRTKLDGRWIGQA